MIRRSVLGGSLTRQARHLGLATVALVFGAVVTGCVLFDDSGPENARMLISFEGGQVGAGSSLQLITSNNFTTTEGGQGQSNITLRSADTIRITLPYDEKYSIGSDKRFFAQVANLDSIPVVLSIKVDLDGDVRMDQTTAVGQPVEFLYILTEF